MVVEEVTPPRRRLHRRCPCRRWTVVVGGGGGDEPGLSGGGDDDGDGERERERNGRVGGLGGVRICQSVGRGPTQSHALLGLGPLAAVTAQQIRTVG